MARNKKPIPATQMATIQVVEALTKPELRRYDKEISTLNRQNGELLRKANVMGFAYGGQVFVPDEFKTIAGKNYTQSKVAWPQLHPDLWDRADELSKRMAKSRDNLAVVRQYVGAVLAAPELDKYAIRNCIPDYIIGFMDNYKSIPRTEEIEKALSLHPRLLHHFKQVEQTIAILAAGQLIY